MVYKVTFHGEICFRKFNLQPNRFPPVKTRLQNIPIMNKLILPVSLLLAGGGIGFGVVSSMSKADGDALASQISTLEKANQDALEDLRKANLDLTLAKENNIRLQSERDAARKKATDLEGKLATGGGSATQGGQVAGNTSEGFRGMAQDWAKRMDDPEVRGMMKQGQERMISRSYDRFFDNLKLSDDEQKLVGELLADRNMAALDKGRKLLDGSTTDEAAIAAVKKEVEATKAEYDSKLKAVLGEDKFKQLSSYEQTVGDQRMLEFAERNFSRKSAALQPQQKDALLNLMQQERQQTPGDVIPDLGGGPGMSMLLSDTELKAQQASEAAYQQRVIAKAHTVLNPDQISILQDSFKQRNDRRQFGARMGRNFLGGGGR